LRFIKAEKNLTDMSTMERWQGLRAHSPYQAPEAEVLVIRFEERFLNGTNPHNNEIPAPDGEETL
jgi:hypothetical protein